MDDNWEDMELVDQDNSVARLEVKDPPRACRPFYSMNDLEDVDD